MTVGEFISGLKSSSSLRDVVLAAMYYAKFHEGMDLLTAEEI